MEVALIPALLASVGCAWLDAAEPPCEARISTFESVATEIVALTAEVPEGFQLTQPRELAELPALAVPPHGGPLGIHLQVSRDEVRLDGSLIASAGASDLTDQLDQALREKQSLAAELSAHPERPHELTGQLSATVDASANTVALCLDTLRRRRISSVDLIVRRRPQPEVRRLPLPAGFEGYPEARASPPELRARALLPYDARIAALYEHSSCPVDLDAIAQAPPEARLQRLVDAWTAAARGCRCDLDLELLAWHLQEAHLPQVFVTAIPLQLVDRAPGASAQAWGELLSASEAELADRLRQHPTQRVPWPLPGD